MTSVCSFSFGGSNVQTGHFFAANGNARSLTDAQDVGNAFALPVPLRIIAFSWHKTNATSASFVMTRNGVNVFQFDISGSVGASPIHNAGVRPIDSIMRLQATMTVNNTALRSCLITLYFEPVFPSLDRLGGGLNAIPFGGQFSFALTRNRFILRFGAEARTGVDNTGKYVGTLFTVPSPMRLYAVGYQKRFYRAIPLQVYKNGAPVENGNCSLEYDNGVENFPMSTDSPSRQLDAGDVVQLVIDGFTANAGYCTVTLYTTQGTQVAH